MLDIPANKIGLLSFYTPDFQALHDVTGPVKDKYCAKWGYRHIVKTTPYAGAHLYYAFDRLIYIRDLFWGNLPEGTDIEVILCMNGHAQVMNHTIQIQSFLDEDHDFYIHDTINDLNAGVFIIRKTEWSKQWLDFLISLEPIHKCHCWFEQKLIQDNWKRPEFQPRIKIPPHPGFNSFFYDHYNLPTTTPGHFEKGHFCLHLPGKSTKVAVNKTMIESRIEIFTSPEVTNNIIWE